MLAAFFFLAGMVLVSAIGVVLSRSVVHSALFMSGSFLGIAGFFVMLNAPALAGFQVLIYVGAVTVVTLFGIMFTQRPNVRSYRTIVSRQSWPGFFVALGVGAFIAFVLGIQDWSGTRPGNGLRTVGELGNVLLGVSGPPIMGLLFEVISVLLLIAVVAAIVISRRKTGEGTDRPGVE